MEFLILLLHRLLGLLPSDAASRPELVRAYSPAYAYVGSRRAGRYTGHPDVGRMTRLRGLAGVPPRVRYLQTDRITGGPPDG
jgi:hypothetical protein